MASRTQQINFLAAVSLASSGDVSGFQNIVAYDGSLLDSPQRPQSAFSILLYFLPEAIPFSEYTNLLRRMVSKDFNEVTTAPTITSAFSDLTDEILTHRAGKLADYITSKVQRYGWLNSSEGSYIDDWIKARVRLVDTVTGLAQDTSPLFSISDHSENDLFIWQHGIVQVVTSFRSIYHNQAQWISLASLEELTPRLAVQLLLQFTTVETVVRDVNTLVVPYLTYKCSHDNDYSALWEWIGQSTNIYDEDPPAHLLLLVKLVEAGGIRLPTEQANFDFIRAILAFLYTFPSEHYTPTTYLHFGEIQKDLGDFELDIETPDYKVPEEVVETDLYSFGSLQKSNLTSPTLYSLSLLNKFVSSGALLALHIPHISLIEVVVTSLFGSEEDQTALARKYIFSKEDSWRVLDSTQWSRIRDNIRWLKTKSKVLSKVPDSWIDETLLVSTLKSGRFDFVQSNFVDARRTAVSTDNLTKHLLDAFYENYDKATNCSTSRGSLKNAAACIKLLETKHATKSKVPSVVSRASRLLSATNELSVYALTLTPDVVLHPVELRCQTKDPLIIIHRILELNSKAYHDLEKLQAISTDIVYGILGKDLPHTDLKVIAMCIDAALVDSNFDQACKYTEILRELPVPQDDEAQQIVWTACYQVGKFVSPYWDDSDVKLVTTVYERQLELLGHTLATAPRENLSPILNAWKRVEAQIADAQQFGDTSLSDSNPQLDAIKATTSRFARAIQSSAAATFSNTDLNMPAVMPDPNSHSSSNQELHNSRKRDQLSGLLVSGLGWAIGANPR